ncbi:mating-type switching protein swi10 [Pyricularia oryzae 70-15]|uniref:Mating-type switching protein swi10 n=1 Tax=Pyricularia oryzae (strain 70-15 / ATCC MYA-4617 / FGSC 8958) TaxID=242507 RepID=G4ND24_PYRO7|nr:mating-type switching protein swi10 [Pyricularia oryzae 70-15]EHA48366.1 mating-type switching protein swi10 [Pyricularia oryzae 70-15]
MDDDDFGADDDFIQALAGVDAGPSRSARPQPQQQQQQQQAQAQRVAAGGASSRIQQPTPQRVDKAPPPAANGGAAKIVQPTPQALPSKSSGSSILVSPRQKSNPVLEWIKSVPWEYSDIPADYVLGLTTCALFLSLKYHRLHPEYIYTRIRNLQGKFNMRILLTMVDIPNHEEALRELSKTSLVNDVTLMLCWSSHEAARYLELYKSYEHASFAAIRAPPSTGYAEKLVEFVTVPRAINKSDAVALVSTFGSLRNAINADPDQVAAVSGWGERKVKAWCKVVEQPFRVKKAGAGRKKGPAAVPLRESVGGSRAGATQQARIPSQTQIWNPNIADVDDEDAMLEAALEESRRMSGMETNSAVQNEDTNATEGVDDGSGSAGATEAAAPKNKEQLSDGIAAALARLRENG